MNGSPVADEPASVIEGTRSDRPGGRRTLTPLCGAAWFGARLHPDGHEINFHVPHAAGAR